MRDYYQTCMDTESIEERSITDLQEILKRLGGWPVVEGDDWQGEEGFLWHELSIKAAQEGFDTSRIISIGQAGNIVSQTLHQQSQVCPRTPRTLRGG